MVREEPSCADGVGSRIVSGGPGDHSSRVRVMVYPPSAAASRIRVPSGCMAAEKTPVPSVRVRVSPSRIQVPWDRMPKELTFSNWDDVQNFIGYLVEGADGWVKFEVREIAEE